MPSSKSRRKRPERRAARVAVPARMTRPAAATLLAVALGAAALGGTVWWFARPAPRPPGHPAHALDAESAQQVAMGLSKDGHHLASLPYFESVARQAPGSWSARLNHSSALANAAQESRAHLGTREPAIRSSVERVAMVKGSLDETIVAERLVSTPQERRMVMIERSRTLIGWGFPLDAWADYARAEGLDPRRVDLTRLLGGRPIQ